MNTPRPESPAPRRPAGSISSRLSAALLIAGLALAVSAAAADRPVAAYANQRAADATPASGARAGQASRVALGKPQAARLARERAASDAPKGVRPKIGFPREVAALGDSTAFAAQLNWETLPDGSRVAAVSIESPEATGLRIGLRVESLPRATTLRLYAQSDRASAHAIGGGAILDALAQNRAGGAAGEAARTYWLPMVAGTEATLEIELPAGIAPEALRLALPRVSHLFLTPRQHETETTTRRAAACNLDISCQPYLQDWVDQSKSVALVDFVDDGYSYVCSGTLLADRANSFTPYFLSANHCIDSQTVASTVETTWFYRSATCNGTTPFRSQQVTGGATLLYNSATTDTSFMRLNNAAPDGAIFAGWLPELPARHTEVVGLHHPTGDWQKISFGFVSDYEACRDDPSAAVYCENAAAAAAQFIAVTWQEGITESGSSGSGIWVTHADGNRYLVGALYAGSSSCYSAGTDTYGRFDLAYNTALRQWLNAGGAAEYALTVNRSEGGAVAASGIDCGSDCTEVFATGTAVTLTATPASGYSFAGWGGTCSGSATSCGVTMSAARAVDAYFVRGLSKGTPLTQLSGSLNSETLYALAVPAGAADLTIQVGGGSGDVDIFVRRDAIPTSSAYDCLSENPDTTESCVITAPPQGTYYILLMGYAAYSGVTLTASYATTLSAYSLGIATSGTGTVTSSPAGIDCGTDCIESYLSGTSVTLTATPAAGASFTGWGGACSGTATSCTLTMAASVTVAASFADATQTAAADCLFGWAERSYADWFAPAGTASQTLAGYYLRHYTASQSYLGLLDGRIYYLGPLTGNGLVDLGPLADWLGAANCD
jgi:hypothetical protein